MFGLTLDKVLILTFIAAMLLGPERLPEYAAHFARLVKSLRRLGETAKERVRDEMGPDFDDMDWKKLDPRQYDPRRIIQKALSEDETHDREAPPRPVRAPTLPPKGDVFDE